MILPAMKETVAVALGSVLLTNVDDQKLAKEVREMVYSNLVTQPRE